MKTMDGRIESIETTSDVLIGDLKQLIEQKMGVVPARQRLIAKAKLLQDDKKLSDYSKKTRS